MGAGFFDRRVLLALNKIIQDTVKVLYAVYAFQSWWDQVLEAYASLMFFSRSARIEGFVALRPTRVGGAVYPRRSSSGRRFPSGNTALARRLWIHHGGWLTTSRAVPYAQSNSKLLFVGWVKV
jgi:hypothetical protein